MNKERKLFTVAWEKVMKLVTLCSSLPCELLWLIWVLTWSLSHSNRTLFVALHELSLFSASVAVGGKSRGQKVPPTLNLLLLWSDFIAPNQ